MDGVTYQAWWPLHVRVAKGEALAPEERAAYEAGLHALEQAEELAPRDLTALRAMRQEAAEAEAVLAAVSVKRERLQAEVRALEAALPERMRRTLGITD
jgi:hypothetical protein